MFEQQGRQTDSLFLALESVADYTGQQAGNLLVMVQLLARDRLISMADAKRMVRLLAQESPEAQRVVIAQCVAHRKARPVRPSATGYHRA
jgi:hypothetical protein